MAEVKFSEFPVATGADLASVFVVGLNELNANAQFPGTDLKGDTGLQGPPGPEGAQGGTGPQGDAGVKGDDGAQGIQGIQGEQGPQGLQGNTGLTGPEGPIGPEGPQGIQGDAGSGYNLIGDATVAELNALNAVDINTNDAYSIIGGAGTVQPTGAVQPTEVVNGDLVVWSASSYFVNYGQQSGTKGDTGDTGPIGPQGPQGIQGDTGVQGDAGPAGNDGQQGVQGIQGPQGAAGIQGDTGADGTAATADAGTTTTGAPNTNAQVTNVGTTSAAVFDFVVPQGVAGSNGTPGATGEGVPPAGLTGQALVKSSNADFDTEWTTPAGGGDVIGVAPSVTGNIAIYADTTGKVIDDTGVSPSDFATSAQGALADTSLQPGQVDNVSELNNDAGYGTGDGDGDVVGPASAVDDRIATFNTTTGKLIQDSGFLVADFATSAQGDTADTALQPGEAGASSDANNLLVDGADNLSYLDQPAVQTAAYASAATLPDPAAYPEGFLFCVTA